MILNSYRALAIVESGVAAFGGVAMNLSEVDRNLFTFGGGDEINPTSKYPVRP